MLTRRKGHAGRLAVIACTRRARPVAGRWARTVQSFMASPRRPDIVAERPEEPVRRPGQ